MNLKNIRVAALMLLLPSLLVAAPVAVSPGSTFSLIKLKPIQLNASTHNPSAAPGTCSSRTVSWAGSASCSASVGALANGATASLTDSSGNVGSATVTCNAATNSIAVSGASSCMTAAAASKPCPSQSVAWGGCSGTAPNALHGSASGVTDSTSPTTGTATFTCSDGAFVYSGGSCVTTPTTCTSKTLPWSVGVNNCSAISGITNGGQNKTLSNSAANGYGGSATFSCTAASDSYQLVGSPTCAPIATTCSAQSVGWASGGVACTGSVASTSNNATRSVASTNGNSGSAVFACNAASNTYTTTGTPTCSVPAPTSCTNQSKTWGTSPNNCSASTGTTAGGTTKTISNTNANGNNGSASFVCNASTNTYTVSGTPSCSVPAATSCTSQTKTWGTSPNNCSASTGTTAGGATSTVSNSNANGNNGSASFVCNAATNTYTVSGTPSCSVPAATSCTSQTKTWGTSPNNCSATTGSTSNGATSTVSNSNANGNIGSASFVCDAATNSYAASGAQTCNAPNYIDFERIVAGESHVCGIGIQQGVRGIYCWGDNTFGQLGDGTYTSRSVPTKVTGLPDFGFAANVSIADLEGYLGIYAGKNNSCLYLYGNGVGGSTKLICWGSNVSGQLANGSTSKTTAKVTIGKPRPSNIILFGIPDWSQSIYYNANVTIGNDRICADMNWTAPDGRSKNTGTACWGNNSGGALFTSAGDKRTATLSSCAEVNTTLIGSIANYCQPGTYNPVRNINAPSITNFLQCYQANDRDYMCNLTGSLTSPPSAYTKVRTFYQQEASYARLGYISESSSSNICEGSRGCFGRNNFGQLGNGTTSPTLVWGIVAPTLGAYGAVQQVAVGNGFICWLARASDNKQRVLCSGDGSSGKLGNGLSSGNRTTPTPVLNQAPL